MVENHQKMSKGNYKHGLCRSRFWNVWNSMRSRCNNPKTKSFKDYGAKGVAFCERWNVFMNFQEDMYQSYLEHKKEHQNDTTIDRIDNAKGYYKENCRWTTRLNQNRNRKNSTIIEHHGIKLCLSAWCEKLGIHRDKLYRKKLKLGSYELAIQAFT